MSETSPVQGFISTKESKDSNKYSYISTYNMGNIGIKKIIEDSFTNQKNIDNNNKNIKIQSFPINNMSNITSNNTNNTNTNTNSNTNNNTSKNKDNQINKKIIKNKHSASPNSTHIYTKNSSNTKYYYYKSKTNQRLNIIKKNNLGLKMPKKEFSKTCNNFYIYTSNNITNNKNKNYNISNNNYSKKKNRAKSNTKLIKEKKIIDGPIKPLSSHTSCFFSPMTPISIKRQKKYSIPNIISNTKIENDINSNIISLKREIKEKKLNCNYKNTSTDMIQNSRKLILINEMKNDISNSGLHEDNNNELKHHINQMTEGNINYLRVRKRCDIHMNSNNGNNNKKIQSSPVLITDTSNIKFSSAHTSCIFNDDSKNGIISNNRIINISENHINLNTNIPSTEKCTNTNSVLNSSIPELFLNDKNNINKLYPEKIRNSDNNKNHMNINISNTSNEKKIDNEIKKVKVKNIGNNFDKDCNKKSSNIKNKNTKTKNSNNNLNTSKNYSFNKNKKYNKNHKNNNDDVFIEHKKKCYNNIKSLKDVKTEENKNNKNNRNNKKYYNSYSRNKLKNKNKKDYSLINSKNNALSNHYKNKTQSNRNKSSENKNYKVKVIDINKKKNDNNNIIKKEEKTENINIDCPEEMHYFLVNLTINYKYLNENF